MQVLLIVHGFPPGAMGGTELYAASQASALAAAGDEVFVFTRESVPGRPEYDVRENQWNGVRVRFVNRTFRDVASFADSYRSERVLARFGELLDEWRPDVAHIHHLTCLSTTIVSELARRDIPVVLTLHDYWMVCHRGQLLDRTLNRCVDPRTCRACLGPEAGLGRGGPVAARAMHFVERIAPSVAASALRQTAGVLAGAFASDAAGRDAASARAAHMREILGQVSQILAPSRHMRDRFAAAAGLEPSRIVVSEYGIDLARFGARPARSPGPLRLGFLGSLMVSKAPHLLVEALRRLPEGAATVMLAGAFTAYHGDESYRDTIDPLLRLPDVQVTGPVPHEDVPRLLGAIDVLVVPSIWEENSPLVIREAFAAGVPVVASRIGGIPETVRDGESGLLFEAGDAADLSRVLQRLIDDPELLDRLRRGIPAVRSLDDATRETRAIYAGLVGARPRPSSFVPRPSSLVPRVAAVVLNYQTPDDTLLTVRSLLASRHALSEVIVVDNASGTECEEALEGVAHQIRFISAGSNLGFSGGMNLGIRSALQAEASHVFLVNSDVIVPPATIGRLLATLVAGPTRGVVSPIVAARARPGIVASRGMSYSDATGRMRHRGVGEPLDLTSGPDWESTPAVSGCALLISRAVFDAVGLLDEAYFFSFEDLAFCLAARDAGFDVGVARSAVVFHEGSRTLGPTSVRRFYLATRNHLRVASARPSSSPLAGLARSAAIVGYNLAYAITAPGGTLGARLGAVVRGTRDHVRGRYGADSDS